MKLRLILIGVVAALVLPLAAANAGAVLDPGLNWAGAGADLERGTAPTAENFGRQEDEDKDDQHHKHHKCHRDDKGDHANWDDRGDKDDHCCDRDDRGDKCERSPSKPNSGLKE
jgi:hypothetical protein